MRPGSSGSYRSYSPFPRKRESRAARPRLFKPGAESGPLSRGQQFGRPTFFSASCLDRHIALQHDTIEISQLLHIVIAIGLVQQRAVVPHDEVARPPPVTVLVSRLRRVLQQVGEQGL